MPETVIAHISTLGRNQTKIITLKDRHGYLIGYIETPGVGSNLDDGEVEFPGVDAELEEEDIKMPYIDPEGNVEIPGVNM